MISLDLTNRGLEHVPDEVFAHADTLEELSLSNNRLTSLPPRLVELRRLKRLFCSGNPFETVPDVLGQLPALEMIGFKSCALTDVPAAALPPRLRWLILTDNRLTSLPEALGNCTRMQKLALAGNQLTSLPGSFTKLTSLELLRISANRFTSFPTALLSLPKLSWLAFAGNPFCVRPQVRTRSISWRALSLHEVLGQGASGVISRATFEGHDVAVKVFKGAVTSDGLPEDEVTACLVAGSHRHLIGVEGRVTDHPHGADALVLTLMPPRFHPLGAPPDFQSCTRDVMSLTLGAAQSLRIARHVAEVGAQLHERGVLHGDLYAHNTRVDDEGDVLLGDFGAASLMNGLPLEHLDVRAFGAMLDDLRSCGAPAVLSEMRDVCWSSAPPRFADLLRDFGRSLNSVA
ncbi:MAG: protein kinase [Archangium gephyra]|uniref:Protein kinase n=1 Tax=Archangium gephyra TaxID=48 RepID=A0A2W5UP12_9BACT|nr:MAG: protein kinase [Archangium gephyra]